MAFDITKFAAADTAVIKLMNGDDTPLLDDAGKRLTVTVYGPGSEQYAEAQQRKQNRIVARLRKKGKVDASATEIAAENAEFLAACTVSFDGWTYPPAGNVSQQEIFRAAYADPKLGFIRDQVFAFIGEWENFTGNSATS